MEYVIASIIGACALVFFHEIGHACDRAAQRIIDFVLWLLGLAMPIIGGLALSALKYVITMTVLYLSGAIIAHVIFS
jgi:hypothetical protein